MTTPKVQTLTLPMAMPGMNETIDMAKRFAPGYGKPSGSRFNIYASEKLRLGDLVKDYCTLQGLTPIKGPVTVTFQWSERKRKNGQRRDPDNVAAGKKYILDGLVKAGVLKDDGPDIVKGLLDVFTYNVKEDSITVLIMEDKGNGDS